MTTACRWDVESGKLMHPNISHMEVNWYDVGIQKLPLRLQKCIDRNGDYVEK
jgi:hypothetical protein